MRFGAIVVLSLVWLAPVGAQEAPAPVSVDSTVSDEAIAARLLGILRATGWFEAPAVRVDQGVAFLEGRAESEERKEWAGELARKTEGVVAVVNQIGVPEPSMWDLSPAWAEIRQLGSAGVRRSPLLLLALVLLAVTWWAAATAAGAVRSVSERRFANPLLQAVASRLAAVPILLLGLYVVLRISGLSGLAATLLGGTGLAGLILGFAFRDIAENFLASLMISIQHPFATGDRIAVAGHEGFVQSVNVRSTVLMTLEGNHVQIPNAVIYKETMTNFTANPNTRFDFAVGIGYENSIEAAQAIVRTILGKQEGLTADPEPWVIVEGLGSATVNLRVYFWVDTGRFNGLKVRSAVIRAVKKAFEAAGVSMPDEAREVVFPAGIEVRVAQDGGTTAAAEEEPAAAAVEPEARAEGDLTSESVEIEQQAQRARTPEAGPNLLGGQ